MEKYTVYLIQCEVKDGTFRYYTGKTANWEECWRQHIARNGAIFTKQYRPVGGVPVYFGLSKKESDRLERVLRRKKSSEKETLFIIRSLDLL